MPISTYTDAAGDAFRNIGDFASGLVTPTVRLGVTGLARSGKTVFITALVHNLIVGGRLPFFDAAAQGRLLRAYLEPQPDELVPRFEYEKHLADLTADPPRWPESTRRISQLRLTLEYASTKFWKRQLGRERLHIDIVDYPGEWLLDLPLLQLDYAAWSRAALEQARAPERKAASKDWHRALAVAKPADPADEAEAATLSDLFKAYLTAARSDQYTLSTLPPGRFLMPGDLEGSPALTFAPLDAKDAASFPRGSLWSLMERRYEAYKSYVVRPFFRDHFSRLDRQIVLIDVLAALNGGHAAVADLERAMTEILECYRTGANSLWSNLFAPRIDRIVLAATKADHLHHESHDRLEAILSLLTDKAMDRARYAGAEVKVLALAAVRATREGQAKRNGETLPCIVGYPLPGETIGRRTFDGNEAFAIFPGDLPADPQKALQGWQTEAGEMRFVRFRPPDPVALPSGGFAPFPNIRLDRAIQALIGDRLE
ncbi:amino acid regulated cytosolic protein [Methyloceanibacter superfactus]|uniref:Amino acid regulated cytosolic protein n=1 Tax=Methyloceanibacter superfactus TaxID=1774969 RepID=A0A1E3W396_9HYPH|nr:YcjX family protein [Methyloceanibacter superfactus]ODS00298.1 amino acid regulated cytosolic protein [Methyloceanibacter superfactus]